jgi:plastocyanin
MRYRLSGACLISASLMLGGLVGVEAPGWAAPRLPTLSPSDTEPDTEVLITIRARAFEPATVPLRAGRKTKLVFHNLDAELHAFVPVGLLTGLNLNISGDGAPQFDAHGLKRVIVPSQGKAEIRFVPVRKGIYPYFCDMPGHEMSATIVVE